MTQILKAKNLEIQVDFPLENYNFSRFDWTGKIVGVRFKNIQFASIEDPNGKNENLLGKGFYNEFGIDTALGFDETEMGGWFHKIGVGLLKKEDSHYDFNKHYEIRPAEFHHSTHANGVLINCISPAVNGYSYELRKEIAVQETSFTIKYYLKNTGNKIINTNEYVHNFTAINNELLGENYSLKFPFKLKPETFGEAVNPELAVAIEKNGIKFNCMPNEQFFFSNLSGGKSVSASWELINRKSKIGIREKTSFQTNRVNLWGWRHVISPELFFDISIAPGTSTEWLRKYEMFHI